MRRMLTEKDVVKNIYDTNNSGLETDGSLSVKGLLAAEGNASVGEDLDVGSTITCGKLRIGKTQLTEDQLKALLALIENS